MLPAALLATVLALSAAAPSASPSPSPTPRALKTIVTVISSPYCNALAQHFNGALVPMLGNDKVFDGVNVQLLDINVMFKDPDYASRFVAVRTKMLKETDTLVQSLHPIRDQIDALRQSATLSGDPAAAQQMRDAAAQLQEAYNHQFQLSTDLTNMAQEMMRYPITTLPHPLNGWTPEEQSMPAEEKDIKVYLHFDKQRTSIDDAESRAVDIAYNIAESKCTK